MGLLYLYLYCSNGIIAANNVVKTTETINIKVTLWARLCNNCCNGKATMSFMCTVELHVNVNYIKILSAVQQ